MSSAAKSRRIGACVRTAIFVWTLGMSGCLSTRDLKSHELIAGARPPISPEAVQVYLEAPSRRYEEIAVLYSSSRRSWTFTSQSKADVVVRRLKEEAASLGANGVLLHEIAERPGTTVGTDVGTNYMGPRGTADLGVSVSALTFQRYGRGIAIYLPP
jgi:hypothetical protein